MASVMAPEHPRARARLPPSPLGPIRLRCAGGKASSAASLRAISVWRFSTGKYGLWIGRPVFGALTSMPEASIFSFASSA